MKEMNVNPEVKQVDIDAAVRYWSGWSLNDPVNHDGTYHPLVLTLAKHRLSSAYQDIPASVKQLYSHACSQAMALARQKSFDNYLESDWFKLTSLLYDMFPTIIEQLHNEPGCSD